MFPSLQQLFALGSTIFAGYTGYKISAMFLHTLRHNWIKWLTSTMNWGCVGVGAAAPRDCELKLLVLGLSDDLSDTNHTRMQKYRSPIAERYTIRQIEM